MASLRNANQKARKELTAQEQGNRSNGLALATTRAKFWQRRSIRPHFGNADGYSRQTLACFRPYRYRSLQVNIHLVAFFGIDKIKTTCHLPNVTRIFGCSFFGPSSLGLFGVSFQSHAQGDFFKEIFRPHFLNSLKSAVSLRDWRFLLLGNVNPCGAGLTI